ncbi:cation diffusion facilitator family transporter [Corynebacterium sp. 153RC1]|uniref:cation diffusion facilitator family transporter n=1 Tax=unclassified Corynebacterium TaxID=2624378 RepID=UPI00211BEB92|nr:MULTISPECIES: cation diffusion facilitator family transporter [unclassified Corynebacterium]MCQ9352945.1 cation diffusion facilitator family transporter [Corynebacterium sp. 209RC1]MCQ9353835.1 cation diffusion facilitator family transporter [Corynebacterium sp. 1222RC1]MCQ9356866.1 cation diffusion facilitator family transporter [Corynebacterium sp. 122RC1]MCQ9358283.1 cation diffusion facilitator family transporter [Corynebacterium sp. 142RC1]MCQ9361334.1 cation diffusion facilitator fami
MSHDHGAIHHSHSHSHSQHGDHNHLPGSTKALLWVLLFTAAVFLVELVGGFLSGSLALISDAMHMLSDATGLMLAAVAAVLALRGASARATFGYKRVEVFAALVNGAAVSAIAVVIVWKAVVRLGQPGQVDTTMMLVVGSIGLVANAIGAGILHGHRGESMNVEGAFLHVLTDLLGSVAVIVAAVIMITTGFMQADSVASFLIAALILPRSLKLFARAVRVLLEQAPEAADTAAIHASLLTIPQVTAVHDLHVWSLDGNEILATCHLVVDTPHAHVLAECGVLDAAQQRLQEFGIRHSTIQLETTHHMTHEQVCNHDS